jgi:hypothetical protein
MKYTNRILILALFMSGLATNNVYTAPITFNIKKGLHSFGKNTANFILGNTENLWLVEIAKRFGACPNVRLDREGNTLFHRAVANPANPNLFKIARQAGCDPNLPNYKGITPGMMALRRISPINPNLLRKSTPMEAAQFLKSNKNQVTVELVKSGARSESFTRNAGEHNETIRFLHKLLIEV